VIPEAPHSLSRPRPAQTRPPAPERVAAREPEGRRFRRDIQGLRAIAVLLVVLYHAGVPGIRGGYVGVDVFFVISGFLITGQLLREVDQTGRISFAGFYANRLRRLLPPAALVLVVTVVVARVAGSLLQFRSTALDTVFTAGYLFNYRLAEQGVNYQNASGPQSPLQHFWSLAVEEQFYLLWPLLLALCVGLTHRFTRRHRRTLITGLLVTIFALSLYGSVTVTAGNAPLAYFSLQTRAWELAAGALIAIGAGWLSRRPAGLAVAGSWIGTALILTTGILYTEHTPFPGSAAVLPVAGCALVIAAGCRPARGSAERLLALPALQGIGAVSYSWYLWHWPVIVLAPRIAGQPLTGWDNLGLMAVALAISVASYRLIESPARRLRLPHRRWAAIGFSVSGAVAALAVVLLVTMPALVGSGAPVQALSLDHDAGSRVRTAVSLGSTITAAPMNLAPALDRAGQDQPVTSLNGCHLDYLDTVQPDCVYGDPNGDHVAVLVGDSHAQQWLPALDQAARDQGWQLIAWTKAACSLADVPVHSDILQREFTECAAWREAVIPRITRLDPELVIAGQSDTVPDARTDDVAWGQGTASSLAAFQRAGIPVTYLGDTPSPGRNVPDCVAEHLADLRACSTERRLAVPAHGRAEHLRETLTAADIEVIDPADWFCTPTDCPAVVGNLLVYRDGSHLSTAYSHYLAPLFRTQFKN
jgi:peptidoglycan/LPS O-acetylase OafA/YrhL